MSEMLRRGRRVVVATTVASCVMFAGYAGTALASDFDHDGVSTPADCNDLNPNIHPGAVDKPDPNFVDSNCDGIDGDVSNAIFVSLGGNDAAPGTLTNPVRTVAKGIALANAGATKKDVYIAGGEFDESVNLVSGVSLYGDYEPITGQRSLAQNTIIKGAPAVTANGVTGVVLGDLTLQGLPDGSGNAVALRAVNNGANPSRLVLSGVTAQGLPAGGPINGGGGGLVNGGGVGGVGGAGGCGNGVGGSPGSPGAPGGLGINGGTAGNDGLPGLGDFSSWPRFTAGSGGNGGGGVGGTGGTGGAGATNFVPICGGQGGTGGTGGTGGGGGGGGVDGAGSFGAMLLNSSIVAIDGSKFVAASGGSGGNGGNGGIGTSGGGGFGGASGTCTTIFVTVCSSAGNTGFPGGKGGNGGGGGAGVGGPSAAVYQAGAGSGFSLHGPASLMQTGAPGTGGLQGNGTGVRAANGIASPAGLPLRSTTAPATSTADFDGDGITDPADACPDVARNANGATDANGDGCPDLAPALTDTDGDGIPDNADACPTVPAGANDANGDGCPDPAPAPGGGGGGGTGGGGTGGGGGGGVVTPPAPEQIVVTLSFFAKASAKHTKLTSLKVRNIPLGATVHVTCKGKGCPKGLKGKGYTKKNAFGALNLKKFIKKPLRVGVTITVVVSKPNAIDAVKILTIRKSKTPKISTRCLPPGAKRAVACA